MMMNSRVDLKGGALGASAPGKKKKKKIKLK
jgi:hypothetical protein